METVDSLNIQDLSEDGSKSVLSDLSGSISEPNAQPPRLQINGSKIYDPYL